MHKSKWVKVRMYALCTRNVRIYVRIIWLAQAKCTHYGVNVRIFALAALQGRGFILYIYSFL